MPALCLHRGPCTVILPRQEEPSRLGMAEPSTAGAGTGSSTTGQGPSKAGGSICASEDHFRLSASFKPLHEKPWLYLPPCRGCPALGLHWALVPYSLQSWLQGGGNLQERLWDEGGS